MRAALTACVLLLSCGDDSAPPGSLPEGGHVDAPSDGSGGAGGGGTGGSGGMDDGGGPDAPFMVMCSPPCQQQQQGTICIDPDGPGPMGAFCGCPDDAFCQMTGHCETSGPNIGRCRCGTGLPCVMGITICVNNACQNIRDAGL